jgi:hypothetical protein
MSIACVRCKVVAIHSFIDYTQTHFVTVWSHFDQLLLHDIDIYRVILIYIDCDIYQSHAHTFHDRVISFTPIIIALY